jgi:hypothetical protein
MARRVQSLLILCLLASPAGFAQISFPGSGNGGTGFPFPGRSRRQNPQNTQNSNNQTQQLIGMLRSVNGSDIVIENSDKLIVTVNANSSTKYYKASGGPGKLSDLMPGDHLTIDATQDNSQLYRAVKVTQVRLGTDEERAQASAPVPSSPAASSTSSRDSGGGDDRPRLRRATGSDDSSSGTQTASSSSPSSSNDDDRPRLRRDSSNSDSASTTSQPQAQITRGDDVRSDVTASRRPAVQAPSGQSSAQIQSPAPPDADDPGRPVLKRGGSSDRRVQDAKPPVEVAEARPQAAGDRPSLRADDANGRTRLPAPPPAGDPIIEKAREEAFQFSETLPNYVVKQFTTRYATGAAARGQTSWQALDNVTADVVVENGVEKYKNVLVNGKPPKESLEKSGSWSEGEFSSLQLDVLDPRTNADFHNKRTTTIVNRSAYRYDFTVDQPNSHWHVSTGPQSYLPGYGGTIWFDKETGRVLRIEMQAQDLPKTFQLDQVESAVDYDFVILGDHKYLLPVHSEALSCMRGTKDCGRNTIDFRNYKKFQAESSITFDPDK